MDELAIGVRCRSSWVWLWYENSGEWWVRRVVLHSDSSGISVVIGVGIIRVQQREREVSNVHSLNDHQPANIRAIHSSTVHSPGLDWHYPSCSFVASTEDIKNGMWSLMNTESFDSCCNLIIENNTTMTQTKDKHHRGVVSQYPCEKLPRYVCTNKRLHLQW